MFPHSIKWQTQLYYSLLITGVVTVMAVGFYRYEKRVLLEQIDSELTQMLFTNLPAILRHANLPMHGQWEDDQSPLPERRFPPNHDNAFAIRTVKHLNAILEGKSPRYFLSVWSPDFKILLESVNAPEGIVDAFKANRLYADEPLVTPGDFMEKPRFAPDESKEKKPGPKHAYAPQAFQWFEGHRITTHVVPVGLIVNTGIRKEAIAADLQKFAYQLASGGALVTVIAILIGYWILHRGLKPIENISQTAIEISQGDLTQRIPTKRIKNELSGLAGLLNETFERLNEAIQQQVRFNADASHELRTPLAIILSDCGFSLKKERSPERYLKTVKRCHKTALHMKALVEELSLLSKGDASALNLELIPGDLQKMLEDVVFMTESLLEEKQLTLKSDLQPTPGTFNEKSLKQIIVNLVGNAVYYNKEGGTIWLRSGTNHGTSFLEIEDTGIGISETDLKYIFERFYRSDKARSYASGRTGLGLSITKMIVEAHGGTIEVKSELRKGTCFRMEFPQTLSKG